MSLTDLYVIDKQDGRIHRIGDSCHDSFWVSYDGVLHYQNLQNGDGCAGDGYKNGKDSGYAFLPQDMTRPMTYEHFEQPEKCFIDYESVCGYPITDCANCPVRKRIKERENHE